MKKTEDDFGVPIWGMRKDNGVLVEDSPYRDMRDWLELSQVPKSEMDAAQDLRDELYCARSIAVTIFGKHWPDHVLGIYDRLLSKNKEYAKTGGRPRKPYLSEQD